MTGLKRLQSKLTCPHCGSLYEPEGLTNWNFTEWSIVTQFGKVIFKSLVQAKIFDLLWRKQSMKGLTRERIIDIVYQDDISGGVTANTVGMCIIRMRKLLVNVGIFIKKGNTHGVGYSLIFTTPEEAIKQERLQNKGMGKPKRDNTRTISF